MIKIIAPSTKAWYKICRPKHMYPDLAIDEHRLRVKYPAIWKSIHELGLSYVFGNPWDINVNLIREFYAGYDPDEPEHYVPIWGRLIDFSSSALCNYLGAPDIPHDPLGKIIAHPTYRELRYALCAIKFVAAWVCEKKKFHCHIKLPKRR